MSSDFLELKLLPLASNFLELEPRSSDFFEAELMTELMSSDFFELELVLMASDFWELIFSDVFEQ